MDQIEASMPKDQVSEKVVNGNLMELKGLQLQHGVSNTMAVNMTYAQYMKRMGFKEESNKKPRSPSPAPNPSQEQLETKMLEAAAGYLKKEGLDNLDAQKFETAVRDAVRGDGCPVLRMGICRDVSPCIGVGEGGGRRQEEKGSIGGKLSSLWSSMASLRGKMRFGGRDGHTSQDTTKDPLAASFEDTSLLNSHGIPNGRDAGATFEGCHKNSAESQVPEPSAGGGQRKGVQPHTARKTKDGSKCSSSWCDGTGPSSASHEPDLSGHRLH